MSHAAQQREQTLLRTPLYDLHKELGGKLVPFAGYEMPVQYEGGGVLKEHLHTRSAAGLFDVSHMGQALLTGAEDPGAALEKIVPGAMVDLAPEKMRYTVLLNDAGGVLDDLMVTRWDDKTLFLVVNAGCKEKDFAYIEKTIGSAVKLDYLADRALLALQGPLAETVLARLLPIASALKFMTMAKVSFEGRELFLSRSGYTGEDGFEISLPGECAEEFARKLLAFDEVEPIGLGARDSLRLEAGLCLYGHELTEEISPIEANLKWVIQKRRREQGGFAGAARVLGELKDGTQRLRVGLSPEGRAPVREGAEVLSPDGKKIGIVTSGGFGPSADAPVAMALIESAYAAEGTELQVLLRGVLRPCTVAALPFYKTNYKKD